MTAVRGQSVGLSGLAVTGGGGQDGWMELEVKDKEVQERTD